MPATSASLLRVSFFFSFLFLLLPPLTVLMKQTRWLKQSIFFRCLWLLSRVTDCEIFLPMEQHALKNVNNCLNANFYFYLETSGGQNFKSLFNCSSFLQHQCELEICSSLRQLFSCIGVQYILFYWATFRSSLLRRLSSPKKWQHFVLLFTKANYYTFT